MFSSPLLHHHKGQPGPLFACFPTTRSQIRALAPHSLSSQEPSSGSEPAAEGATQKMEQFPTLLQCKIIQELQGNALAPVMLFYVMWCSGILQLAIISPDGLQQGN